MHILPTNFRLPDRKMCLRWLVLMVLVWGTLMSSVGLTTSHGLANLAAADHALAADDTHAHDVDVQLADPAGGHTHHGADHSHDKAHALPAQLAVSAVDSPRRIAIARPWLPGLAASRLDRPPRS